MMEITFSTLELHFPNLTNPLKNSRFLLARGKVGHSNELSPTSIALALDDGKWNLGTLYRNHNCMILFWEQLQPAWWYLGFFQVRGRPVGGLELTIFILVGLMSFHIPSLNKTPGRPFQ